MGWREDDYYFERTEALAREAKKEGDDGFACVLVGPMGDILMEQKNEAGTQKDPTAHDVMALVRRAVREYSPRQLKECTVYALMEPCVMCMGALFWAKIGRVKYAMSEESMNRMLPGGLEIHSAEFAKRCPAPMESLPRIPERPEAVEIVKEWIRSLGIG